MAEQYIHQSSSGASEPQSVSKVTHALGAGISLALVIGAGYWSYKIISRDVTQIPVVEARTGPMRIAPTDPGGKTAENIDLAVTKIPEAPVVDVTEEVTLAPAPTALQPEDAPVKDLEVAKASQEAVNNTLDIDAIANSMVQGIAPLSEVVPQSDTQNIVQGNIEDALRMALDDAVVQPVSLSMTTGVMSSPRPKARPKVANLQPVSLTTSQSAQSNPTLDPLKITAGTALVQFGAYDDSEIAEREWDRLAATLSPLLSERPRVIERAQSGGRVFYRLRAAGFADLTDARRFCSAVTSKTPCIPVVAR